MSKNFKLPKLQYRCYKRDCSGFIEDDFLLEMSEFGNGFLNVSDSISADELVNQFISQIKSTINKHAPLKQMSPKELQLRHKPWITTDIIRASKNKNILFKEMLRNKTSDNINKYKKSKNLLTHMKELAKKAYYKDQLEKNCHDTGLVWKSTNDIVKYKRKSSSLPSKIITSDERDISNPCEISNAFNDYFSTAAKPLSDNIPNPSEAYVCSPSTLIKNTCNSFFLKLVTEEQILYHLKNLNPSKSSGMQGIPIKFFKPASILLAPVLTKLFNIAIEEATFPTIFNTAEFVPLYKNGSKLNCSNYRPISLLCPFSKLLEKCIYDQL